jgi:hypothetical protein
MTTTQPHPGDPENNIQIVGPDGKPIKRSSVDNELQRHQNNGRFISTPKRNRSKKNKAAHAEQRALDEERWYQERRARQIEEAVERAKRDGTLPDLLAHGIERPDDSVSEALNRRKSKRRQGPADKP